MADEILYNSPALHALKRHQLVSLSKRYGLKANGKNSEMIDRLKDHAATLSPSRIMTLPLPAPTPAPLRHFSNSSISPSPTKTSKASNTLASPTLAHKASRLSDTWEVLSTSGASLISPPKSGMTKSNSVRSWKSANNGESLSEFGVEEQKGPTNSRSSSFRALASSLSRRASHHLKSRSASASSNLSKMAEQEPEPIDQDTENRVEASHCPPSPASTIGVPRRHSKMSLLERPSTIRLCSPTHFDQPTGMKADNDELPFFGPRIKERKSLAPVRASAGASLTLGRKSMPAMGGTSASVSNIYPPLPSIGTAITSDESIPPVPPIPGAYKEAAKPFGFTVSNEAFAESSRAVLAQMQARMHDRGIDATFGEELLKGKKAEVRKLVQVNEGLGGGWGLRGAPSTSSIADRYREAHMKEFARMRGIDKSVESSAPPTTPGKRKLSSTAQNTPSAPNGLPLVCEGSQAKKRKMSIGPLGSIREAGKSLVSLLADKPTPGKRVKRRTSNRGLGSRFGLFKRRDSLTNPTASSLARSQVRSSTTSSLARSTRTTTSVGSLGNRLPNEGNRSASAQTCASTGSKTPTRPKLPEFGAARVESLGLPIAPLNASISTESVRKQSHADIIRKARAAPAPPSITAPATWLSSSAGPSAVMPSEATKAAKRTSTLYQPTASSLARMQATVKPPARTLPAALPRQISTTKPFGEASSRFDASLNLPDPLTRFAPKPMVKSDLKSIPASPMKTPGKTASSAALRLRHKQSGLSAVKSKGNLRAESEVNARRNEIRARQARLGEERELRAMLGDTANVE